MSSIGDFFGILFGGAYVAKEVVSQAVEDAAEQERSLVIRKFIEEHTDLELERKLRKQVEDPTQTELVWRRIEEYKRDHPVYCKSHELEPIYFEALNEYIDPHFWWQDVGKKRITLFGRYNSLNGRSVNESMQLEDNRKLVLELLIETYNPNLMSVGTAKRTARTKFPSKPSKRKW